MGLFNKESERLIEHIEIEEKSLNRKFILSELKLENIPRPTRPKRVIDEDYDFWLEIREVPGVNKEKLVAWVRKYRDAKLKAARSLHNLGVSYNEWIFGNPEVVVWEEVLTGLGQGDIVRKIKDETKDPKKLIFNSLLVDSSKRIKP